MHAIFQICILQVNSTPHIISYEETSLVFKVNYMHSTRPCIIMIDTCCILPHPLQHGRINYKDTKPYMSALLSVDLLTDFVAYCLTDFIDWSWRYIHSWFVFLTQLANSVAPMEEEPIHYLCTVAPLLYLLSDLLPPPPLPNVQYIQTVCDCGGGGGC
jgi:hypothetical protein